MKTEYKRDLNNSYLVLEPEHAVNPEGYPVRMLTAHSVPSVLPCQMQTVDGSSRFCYEITSLQSFAGKYESQRLTEAELRLLFAGILRVLEELRDFLISPGTLLLEPEYLFVNAAGDRIFFCCLPGAEESWEKGLRQLLEYVLPKIHHGDSGAVNLGYEMYRTAMQAEVSLEDLKEILYGKREPLLGASERSLSEEEQEEPQGKLWEELFRAEIAAAQEDPQKKQGRKSARMRQRIVEGGIGAGAAVLLLLFTLGSHYGILPRIPVELLMGLWIGVLGLWMIAVAALELRNRRRRRTVQKLTVPPPLESEEYLRPSPPQPAEFPEEEYTRISRFTGYSEEDMDGEVTQMLYHVQAAHPGRLCPENPDEEEILLNGDLLVIGKLYHTADICLARPTVSHIHARIRREDGEYYLTDLNSRNGTYVNGELLPEGEELHLKNGDEVVFADLKYTFYRSA